jgi:hypothetical protein
MSVKLTNAALDVFTRPNGHEEIIIRGVIDPGSYGELLADSYQREIGSSSKISKLAEAIRNSSVPDIELGMRGDKTREADGGKTYYLQDPVFIIDGLQRISAGRYMLQQDPNSCPRIGCAVHLNTNFDWERDRFRILNQERSKVSVSVILRNSASDYTSLDMLLKLCGDKNFVLHGRVCWSQAKQRDHVLNALVLLKIAAMLHSRFGPGRSSTHSQLSAGMDKIMEKIGRNVARDNTKRFFDLVDRCFNIKSIVFTHGAPQVKAGFLLSLADVLTRHEDFWDGNVLFVRRDLEQKLAKFPLHDPSVERLATGGGKSKEMMMSLLINHINSGKRTRRLTLSSGFAGDTIDLEEEEDDGMDY